MFSQVFCVFLGGVLGGILLGAAVGTAVTVYGAMTCLWQVLTVLYCTEIECYTASSSRFNCSIALSGRSQVSLVMASILVFLFFSI